MISPQDRKLSRTVPGSLVTQTSPISSHHKIRRLAGILLMLLLGVSGCISVGPKDGIYSPGYNVGMLPSQAP